MKLVEGKSIDNFVGNTPKRQDYISWDDYFMGVAMMSAMRSKDPSTQVGACLVNDKKRILGLGYNGWPSGIPDEQLPWDRDKDLPYEKTKYAYVVHAEPNAILNSTGNVEGSTLYVTMAPCNECAKLLAQAGVKEVVYLSDPYHDDAMHKAARKIFELKHIPMRRYTPPTDKMIIDYAAVLAKEKK